MPEQPDFYEVLGVEPDAEDSEIEAAYRDAARKWHPDINDSEEATEMMQQVNLAREVLLHPLKRLIHNLHSPTYREWAKRTGNWVPEPPSGARYEPPQYDWTYSSEEGWSYTGDGSDWEVSEPQLEEEEEREGWQLPQPWTTIAVAVLAGALIFAGAAEFLSN